MINGTFSLNVLGINVGGIIGACLQTLDNVLAPQNTFNNKNMITRQSEYQVSLHNVQQQPSTMEDQHSRLQQPQQQLLQQLQPLLQQLLQLTQLQQLLQQLQPLLQQQSQLIQQQPLQQLLQPSFNYGINTTSVLDDNTDSKNKLTDNQFAQSSNPIKKPSLVIQGTNARPKPRKTKEVTFDITEGNEFIEAIVDMRGIRKQKDIIINVYNDNQLIISDPAKTYNVEIMLPSKVVSEPVNKIYKNGILTLKFEKLQK
jgi:HSP20 family molecular chaperone IbpA